MLKRILPWKYLLKQAARAYGVIDPIAFVDSLRKFSEPSEVDEPIELLRAGLIFHARGLINTKAIQHNLDWLWPYWVERQFDPEDVSFLPRAFSISHINLTHRNWTAVGLPDIALYPLVDPRGLVTPLYDGWSLDFWIVNENEPSLLPSRLAEVEQRWIKKGNSALMTVCEQGTMRLVSVVELTMDGNVPQLVMRVKAISGTPARLAVALRPYNPEGVQFINNVSYKSGVLRINDQTDLTLHAPPEGICFSNYQTGDVLSRLCRERAAMDSIACPTGMATAAALYPLAPGEMREVTCTMVPSEKNQRKSLPLPVSRTWPEALKETAVLQTPDSRLQELYDNAVHTLIHLTAGEAVPGPYTYRRFWFRDACLMLNALLALGLEERTLRHISSFPGRQKHSGYYHSQDGEWDSNGQVLWLVNRFQECTGRDLEGPLLESVFRGAAWIRKKRISATGPYRGLLPPGFSAEHFGPNNYYYWDDFWAIAGLRGAARLAARYQPQKTPGLESEAAELFQAVMRSVEAMDEELSGGGIPASPNRRLDAGAIGSLVADYPLRLFSAQDRRIMVTTEYLLAHCLHRGGFFQDIIHAGINAYLTLAIAQILLRRGDDRYRGLIRAVADLASPTGQWPEAIHPLTGGGCMGDGQHGWAAAEWIMMMRSLFIREEEEELVIGSGIFPEWLEEETVIAFGPTPTPYGRVKVEISGRAGKKTLRIDAEWRGKRPGLRLALPGCKCHPLEEGKLYLLEGPPAA